MSSFYSIYPTINVKFILSSISSGLLDWSVNHTSKEEHSVFIVFIIVKTYREIFSNCPNCLFGTKLNNTFDACWELFLIKLQWTNTTSTDSNLGTFSPFLLLSTNFFVLPNNFILSEVNNSDF